MITKRVLYEVDGEDLNEQQFRNKIDEREAQHRELEKWLVDAKNVLEGHTIRTYDMTFRTGPAKNLLEEILHHIQAKPDEEWLAKDISAYIGKSAGSALGYLNYLAEMNVLSKRLEWSAKTRTRVCVYRLKKPMPKAPEKDDGPKVVDVTDLPDLSGLRKENDARRTLLFDK